MLSESLIGVVAEGRSGRVYLDPPEVTAIPEATWKPDQPMNQESPNIVSGRGYGFFVWGDLFTNRQLVALTTFSDLLREVYERIVDDAQAVGLERDELPLREGGGGASAYADAVVTFLAFAINKCADYWSNICTWNSPGEKMRSTFPRQALGMAWDYAEANPFSSSTANWMAMVDWVSKAVAQLPATGCADVRQCDARASVRESSSVMISTDPPYYDNINFADISDFFYVWLRHNLGAIWPEECKTLLTPKAEELIADKNRHESKQEARKYFEDGMAEFMQEVVAKQNLSLPATIYYAYKATETSKDGEVVSTGWDTFLQAVIDAGLQVTATWPMRTEASNRINAIGTNALASSIVLACRSRPKTAQRATRNEFISALQKELPGAVKLLLSGNIAPVDLPQATIGPGIGVFSRYNKIVEANGEAMPVSDALAIINKELDEILHGEESELDTETRFALAWYAQHGFQAAPFGDAESIAKAKNTAVEGVIQAGVGEATAGKFRLYTRSELDPEWDPATDSRLVAWEALQHLAARLDSSESQAAALLERLGGIADGARQLAYLLHKIASDNRWTEEALTYNNLIGVWSTLRKLATDKGEQQQML